MLLLKLPNNSTAPDSFGAERLPARILITDDDGINRLMLSRYVESLGHQPHLAENGQQALDLLDGQAFDALLLDIDMPGLSGYEVLQRLKENLRLCQLPVIMISGLDKLDNVIHCIELGAEDYLTKPFNPVLLRARLNACLEKKYLREQQETLLRREVERLSKLTQLKDQFMSTVSHDLKSPVNIILGFTDLLKEELAEGTLNSQRVEAWLDRIRNNAHKMLGLVGDMLDLARIESGAALKLESLEIKSFLRQQLPDLQLTARQKNIELTFESDLDELELSFDPLLMAQVLDNLLSNAIKYTPAGGNVWLIARRSAEYGGHLLIEVRDTGLGIPAADLPRLFDRFYRVNTIAHQAVSGSGLGLSIVKAAVDSHGGEIWVESQAGQGSSFKILLPIR